MFDVQVMFGKSSYKQIALNELNSKSLREANKMPLAREGSLLNAINEHGLLTYTDFHFLLLLMSTPTRYLLTRYQVSGTRYARLRSSQPETGPRLRNPFMGFAK